MARPSSVLLVMDVGNTQITLGLFDRKKLVQTWRLKTDWNKTADELGPQLKQLLDTRATRLTGVIVASVVPPLDEALESGIRRYLGRKPLFVTPQIKLGIVNRYDNPKEVGADRLVNAVAVHRLFKGSAIVVDFGTATTFDCVSARGEYLGGVIAPGLEVATEALASRTAKLPKITFHVPSKALGRTTVDSLQSGLFWGYIGLVNEILLQLTKEMGGRPRVIATGGLSRIIGSRVQAVSEILPDLTLHGLRMIWELNAQRS